MMAKSHTVSMMQTVTTSHNTSSYTVLYYGYLKTPSGFLKLGQLICCIVIVSLLSIAHNETEHSHLRELHHLFFYSMSVTFLIITSCILLSYILSLNTYHGLGLKTKFEVITNTVAFLLFLSSTIIYLVLLDERNFSQTHYKMFSISGYCGCALTVIYLINAIIVR